jgi:hypothetical protein
MYRKFGWAHTTITKLQIFLGEVRNYLNIEQHLKHYRAIKHGSTVWKLSTTAIDGTKSNDYRISKKVSFLLRFSTAVLK